MEADIFGMSRSVVQSRDTQDSESQDNETINTRGLVTVATGDAKGQRPWTQAPRRWMQRCALTST